MLLIPERRPEEECGRLFSGLITNSGHDFRFRSDRWFSQRRNNCRPETPGRTAVSVTSWMESLQPAGIRCLSSGSLGQQPDSCAGAGM